MTKSNILTFCAFLSEKFLEGKTYEQVNFADIDHRIERQNLTYGEEQQVRKYVQQRRKALFTAHLLAKRSRPQWVRKALERLSLVMAIRAI